MRSIAPIGNGNGYAIFPNLSDGHPGGVVLDSSHVYVLSKHIDGIAGGIVCSIGQSNRGSVFPVFSHLN